MRDLLLFDRAARAVESPASGVAGPCALRLACSGGARLDPYPGRWRRAQAPPFNIGMHPTRVSVDAVRQLEGLLGCVRAGDAGR